VGRHQTAEHGTAARYKYKPDPCRCAECRAANTAKSKRFRERNLGKEPPEHGYNGYVNYRCRCDICVQGNVDRSRRWRGRGADVNALPDLPPEVLRRAVRAIERLNDAAAVPLLLDALGIG
jgi:hypothetical protein